MYKFKTKKEFYLYMAGLFDGEGCVTVRKTRCHKVRRFNYRLSVAISNSDIKVMRLFQKEFGGKLITRAFKGKPKRGFIFGKQNCYWIKFYGKEGESVLKKLVTFLRIKFEEARLGLEFYKTFDKKLLEEKKNWGPYGLPSSLRDKREDFYKRIKDLKIRNNGEITEVVYYRKPIEIKQNG